MKILKIELQNINSLKSDLPILIDFENEQFKDVGLYAITGSTGAGKTTILDAITIALYHSVPRFNSSKGTLLDVVSYGADYASSRITFENDNIIYEAFWALRLTSKTGKELANPIEEVSLKNLTSGEILATQKRTVVEEVIRVTQLDYEQFLRSVMLAQGEFAAFLTAKGPEKGRLLEQITGEEIYKKIGQAILDRKSKEEQILREIQAKINADDILSEEREIELIQEDKEIDVEILATAKELETIQFVVNWHLKYKELNEEAATLNLNAKKINNYIENHKIEFELLNLNEKAEPFKELIEQFNRNEVNTFEKLKQFKLLEDHLTQLQPKIESLSKISVNQKYESDTLNKEFEDWLPKFDLITKLDGQLIHEAGNQEKTTRKLEEVKQEIELLTQNKHKLTTNLENILSKIKQDEAYLEQNVFLEAVDAERSKWTTDLTTLKANQQTLNDNITFVNHKKSEQNKTLIDLNENKKLLGKELDSVNKIEKDIIEFETQLSKNKLSDLLIKKDELQLNDLNWKQLKSFSIEKVNEEKESEKIAAKKLIIASELELIQQSLQENKQEINKQEASVADAEKILNLEKSIAKYETDRQNLVKGEACGLCGATEHPFTEKLEFVGVSKSEEELQNRKNQLQLLSKTKSELDNKQVELNTKIEHLNYLSKLSLEKIKSIDFKAKQLNIDADLNDLSKIDLEINLLAEEIKSLNEKVETTQQLQVKKDSLAALNKEQSLAIDTLKTKDATLSEKFKNIQSEIETKQSSIAKLTILCKDLEQQLKINLSKFNYQLPSIDNVNSFIERIDKEIATYYQLQKNLEALKFDIKVIKNSLENIKKQSEALNKTQIEYNEILNKSVLLYKKLKIERANILPLDISVETKRNDLKNSINLISEKIELNKKELQNLLDEQTKTVALKIENVNGQQTLKNELYKLNEQLNTQIKDSGFTSKHDIEKALLSKDDKLIYTQNKKQVKENQVQLKTLIEKHEHAFKALNAAKNFEITEEKSKLAFEELKQKRDNLSAKKGEIREVFRKDQEIKDRNQEVYKKIEAQIAICNVWRDLFKIIGGSKDAFNVYVQRLTLKHLLDLANVHLYKLNKRYSLKMEQDYKPKEELNFNLIDHYQTDQARLVDTSSGGEKFIISLALALGLSDLASKNVKIDSLFIDEGFGTLDKNTLETVISTLETLQAQGKMIGIISHVENLKERIPTQIQITKKSSGVSIVEII